MTPTLPALATALRGKIYGGRVLAPGPGHSPKDRSLTVRLSDASPDGFIVHSYAGDDWRVCRDHVADALGLSADRWRGPSPPDPAEAMQRWEQQRRAEEHERAETARRQARARRMWDGAGDPRGTAVEAYLNSRGLELPDDIAGTVLRFHPACPWENGTHPAMVAAIRSVETGEITGVSEKHKPGDLTAPSILQKMAPSHLRTDAATLRRRVEALVGFGRLEPAGRQEIEGKAYRETFRILGEA